MRFLCHAMSLSNVVTENADIAIITAVMGTSKQLLGGTIAPKEKGGQ